MRAAVPPIVRNTMAAVSRSAAAPAVAAAVYALRRPDGGLVTASLPWWRRRGRAATPYAFAYLRTVLYTVM